jgi:hypothetical protein
VYGKNTILPQVEHHFSGSDCVLPLDRHSMIILMAAWRSGGQPGSSSPTACN